MAEHLDKSADGREIEIATGDEFDITLDENPTTGFRWRVTADGSPACSLVKDEFNPPAESRPGQGGSHTWQFRAVRAGQSQIQMSYARGAEGAAARSFALRVRVTK
jgi:inhibitor of cysteine peptidase